MTRLSTDAVAPLLKMKISNPVKMLAFVAAFCIIAAAVSGAFGIVMMRDFFKKSVNPQAMSEVSTYITGSADPLPGFTKVMAARINPGAVVFLQSPDHTEVLFWRYQRASVVDPDEELERMYDNGIWTPTKWAHFQSAAKASKQEIDGRTITYWQGRLKDQEGTIYEGLIACQAEGKMVRIIEVIQPSDRPFDTNKALGWLAQIGR